MNRRTFTSRLAGIGLYLLAGANAVFLTGCNVFSDILSWIPIGEAALNSIIAVLTGNGVIISPAVQVIVQLIESGFAALTAAVKEYRSATPPPVGALAKVQEAFKDITENFTAFLKSVNVSGSLLGIITGLASVVLSTIAAFVTRLPTSAAGDQAIKTAKSVKVGGVTSAVMPKMRTKHAFIVDFNAKLKAAPADVKVPDSAYLK